MTSPRRVALALGIVGVFAGSLALSTGVAVAAPSASPGAVTFGLQAAQAKRADSRAFLSYGVTAGAALTDHVAVENFGSTPLRLSVYAADAQSTAKGDIAFKPAAQPAVDAGSWLSVGGSGVVTVPPRLASGAPGTVIVPIQLRVPTTATPGDHVAAIIASLVTVSTKSKTPLRFDQRVAERAYIRVSGTLHAGLRVEHLQLKFKQPKTPLGKVTAYVSYTVHNTGNVLLATTQDVSVSGLLGGTAHGPKLPALTGLLPGASVRFSTSVPHASPGIRLSAQVTLHPSPALQGNVDGKLAPIRTSTAGWAWIALLIAILLPLLLVWFVWRRYWYYGTPEDETTEPIAGKPSGAGKKAKNEAETPAAEPAKTR